MFPSEIGPEDLNDVLKTGVSVRALLDATYVCVGFNIIARIADALGFNVPSEELCQRAAKLLRIFGYRRLSGYWTSDYHLREGKRKRSRLSNGSDIDRPSLSSESSLDTELDDHHAKKMERLLQAVVLGPGSLPSELRRTIVEGGNVSGALGSFVRKVAEHAFTVNDDDITELHRAHYSDDQIFEATVASALGAGLFRLECVLTVFRAIQSATNNGDFLTQSGSPLKQTSLKITA